MALPLLPLIRGGLQLSQLAGSRSAAKEAEREGRKAADASRAAALIRRQRARRAQVRAHMQTVASAENSAAIGGTRGSSRDLSAIARATSTTASNLQTMANVAMFSDMSAHHVVRSKAAASEAQTKQDNASFIGSQLTGPAGEQNIAIGKDILGASKQLFSRSKANPLLVDAENRLRDLETSRDMFR